MLKCPIQISPQRISQQEAFVRTTSFYEEPSSPQRFAKSVSTTLGVADHPYPLSCFFEHILCIGGKRWEQRT